MIIELQTGRNREGSKQPGGGGAWGGGGGATWRDKGRKSGANEQKNDQRKEGTKTEKNEKKVISK